MEWLLAIVWIPFLGGAEFLIETMYSLNPIRQLRLRSSIFVKTMLTFALAIDAMMLVLIWIMSLLFRRAVS